MPIELIDDIGQPVDEYKTVFVFQAGIDRTNLQRAEFISLLELLHDGVSYDIVDLDDLRTKSKNTIRFLRFDTPVLPIIQKYFVAHITFLRQSAIVLSNFRLNVIEMVRRAGYIHSTGELVFVSKWEALDDKSISNALSDFCILKEEYFPYHFYTDSDNRSHKLNLDPLLIDNKRYHIGVSSFRKANDLIQREHENALKKNNIQKRGDGDIFIYKDAHEGMTGGCLNNFYVDRNITEYAVCYLSRYKKDNPIHTLDSLSEAKPFWAGIFTTPHRLMNAMLNLAKVRKEHIILDPFSHTGTLVIEASQIGCKTICCDIAEVQGAKDNYNFICKGARNMRILSDAIREIVENKKHLHKFFNDLASESAILNVHGLPEIADDKKIENIINKYIGSETDLNIVENRLFFYIVRRYELNKKRQFEEYNEASAMVRKYLGNKKDFQATGTDPSPDLFSGYYHFAEQMEAFEDAYRNTGISMVTSSHAKFKQLFEDNQYTESRVGYVNLASEEPRFFCKDILDNFDNYGIIDNSIDAVISDPPYGYGEDLSQETIENIYINFFEKSFRWIKHGGHLVFCALDKVKTGRVEGLLFTENILRICNRIASKQKIEFITHNIYPIKKDPFSLYFWKSKWALNRAIIVLKISKQ
jgi:tRNA G10  N-methylase Trm11